jgi:hypothetical protein
LDNDLSRFDGLLNNAKGRRQPRKDFKDALKEFKAYKAQRDAPKKVTTPASKATKKQPNKDFI